MQRFPGLGPLFLAQLRRSDARGLLQYKYKDRGMGVVAHPWRDDTGGVAVWGGAQLTGPGAGEGYKYLVRGT